ncbi:MAG: gliding motility lipoprotein GldH [Bacteroidetes bacterium]|nr:gliding motility lipoprotein GldH [Bacteroidota bacterium]
MRFFFIICAVVFVLSACNKNVVYSEYKKIDENKGWPAKERIAFSTTIKDTNQRYNVYINVRNAESYPFKNLFLFLHTTYPNQSVSVDTVECILADEQGRWLGSGMGDLFDNAILLKKNTRFKQAGSYTFSFEQAMRYGNKNEIDPLPFILDMGITIEKSPEN